MDRIRDCIRLLCFLIWPTLTVAQGIFDLSLEQLGDVDVFSSSVLQSHIHRKNDAMIAYSYSRSHMDGMGAGDSQLSSTSVLNDFMVTPLDMDMHMHMVHIMYAPTENTTLMVMLHYMEMEMLHLTRMGARFRTRSEGFGDTELSLNHVLNNDTLNDDSFRWFARGALILPTGNIDARDVTPLGRSQLPYAMQVGGGSYQLKLGLGFDHIQEEYGYGQILTVQSPLDENDAGYRPAERVDWEAWYQKGYGDYLSLDLGVGYRWQNTISGNDQRLNPMMVPTADPDNYGGQRIDAKLGFSYMINRRDKLGLQIIMPLWQDLNGPQLRNKWRINFSWELLL